jgi:hypothetical protein
MTRIQGQGFENFPSTRSLPVRVKPSCRRMRPGLGADHSECGVGGVSAQARLEVPFFQVGLT